MSVRLIQFWAAFLFCALPVYAFGGDLLAGGSLKSLNLFFDDNAGRQRGLLSADTFRLDLTGSQGNSSFELSLEQKILWASRPAGRIADNSVNRVVDLEKHQQEHEKLSGLTQVDRLNIHAEQGPFSWTLGRQALGFGRISLFSPLDVIAPFPPDALDVDVRPGVDALKINRYFGFAGQLGGIIVLGDEKRHNSYLLTAGDNIGKVDILFLGGRLRGRSMVGLGLAGEIGKVGVKSEVSWYRGIDIDHLRGDRKRHYSVAALEGWYRFDNGLVLLGEYLYNGLGTLDPGFYPAVAESAPLREGLGFLLGRHYLLVGPSYQVHPLVSVNALLIYNLKDDSALIRPLLEISLADNLQLDLFWVFAVGEKPGRDPVSGLPVVRSEFGTAGKSGGMFLRWYF